MSQLHGTLDAFSTFATSLHILNWSIQTRATCIILTGWCCCTNFLTMSSYIFHCCCSWWQLCVECCDDLGVGCSRNWMSCRWSQALCRLLSASDHSYYLLERVADIWVHQRLAHTFETCIASTSRKGMWGARTTCQHFLLHSDPASYPVIVPHKELKLYCKDKPDELSTTLDSWNVSSKGLVTCRIDLYLVSLSDCLCWFPPPVQSLGQAVAW